MKPINAKELNRSYVAFSVNFIALAAFSIFCLYLFFAAQAYEYDLLRDEAKKTEELLSKRKEVNTQFDLILLRFNELSKFSTINAEEMDNQTSMLDDIHQANFTIKNIIKQQDFTGASFLLYKKMSDDVTQVAMIQDSLFNTRFQLESIKSQLESCLKVNRAAGDKLSSGIFRR